MSDTASARLLSKNRADSFYDASVGIDDPIITLGHGTPLYFGDMGFPDVERETLYRQLRRLHPDYYNHRPMYLGYRGPPFDRGIANPVVEGADMGAKLEIPTSTGIHNDVQVVPADQRPHNDFLSGYASALEGDEAWVTPAGEPASDPVGATLGRGLYGDPTGYELQGTPGNTRRLSIHSPNTEQYFKRNCDQLVSWGATAIAIDGVTSAAENMVGDFSQWAVNDFRSWLDDLNDARLEELGIDNPASFDVRQYTRDFEGSPAEAVNDPILFEYYLMENHHLLAFHSNIVNHTHETAAEFDTPVTVHGNQFQDIMSQRSTAAVVLSQAFDLIEIEYAPTLPGFVRSEFGYGPPIQTAVHKLSAARSRVTNKPVVQHGFYGTTGTEQPLEAGELYPTLQYLNFAEVFANGSRKQLDLTGFKRAQDSGLYWVDPETGEIPDDLFDLADFLWTHEDVLRATPDTNVAVVYSIPTTLGKSRQEFEYDLSQERLSLLGYVRALREAQIPSEIVIFGHPELWDDSDLLGRLTEYDVLLFPGVTALTDDQLAAVSSFVDEGGAVVHEGEFATRDGRYRERTDPDLPTERVVNTDGAARRLRADGDVSSVASTIRSAQDDPLVEVDKPYPISVEITRSASEERVVHLVNYDYDHESDTVTPREDVSVDVSVPYDVAEVRLARPGTEPVTVSHETSGEEVSVTVPRVDVWAVLTMRRSSTDAGDAGEEIAAAKDAITAARDEGRTHGLVDAEETLREAELASRAGQSKRATSRATEAVDLATAATKPTVVGIDTGHGQQSQFQYDALEPFRTVMADICDTSFQEVTSFDEESFADLDALIVPPPSMQSAIPENELNALESFVRDESGGLAVFTLGQGSAASSLVERFGLGFGDRINEPNGIGVAPLHGHPLTTQIPPETVFGDAVTIDPVPEAANIIAETGVWTPAGIEGTSSSRPLAAATIAESGRVAVYGFATPLVEPKWAWKYMGRNILRWLLNDTKESDGTASTATMHTQETSASEPGLRTEETSTLELGFGTRSLAVGVVLAAVIGILHRIRDTTEEP